MATRYYVGGLVGSALILWGVWETPEIHPYLKLVINWKSRKQQVEVKQSPDAKVLTAGRDVNVYNVSPRSQGVPDPTQPKIVPGLTVGFEAYGRKPGAGTFITPGNGNGGFWEWCDFAGATSSAATSGTAADCQIELYFGPNHSIQAHESIDGTLWSMQPATMHPPTQGIPLDDFFITAGTMTISGPTGAQLIAIAGPQFLAHGCTIIGNAVTCSLSIWEVVPPGCSPGNCIYSPDTGIPAAAGHYNLNNLIDQGGQVGQLQIQVVQLS